MVPAGWGAEGNSPESSHCACLFREVLTLAIPTVLRVGTVDNKRDRLLHKQANVISLAVIKENREDVDSDR